MSVIAFQDCGYVEQLRAILRVHDDPSLARIFTCIYPARDPSDRQWVNGPKILSWDRESSSIRFISEPLTVPDGFLPATLRLVNDRGIALMDVTWPHPGNQFRFTLMFDYRTDAGPNPRTPIK